MKLIAIIASFILINSLTFALSEDRLVIVQSVSRSGQTFAIRRGAIDGIAPGQESLFTNKSMSFKAKSIEANRHYSVWKVSDPRISVPFDKGEMITFTNSLENMWSYLPTLFKNPEKKTFVQKQAWQLSSTYSYGLNETTSDVASDSTSSRAGLQFAAAYTKHFSATWEWQLGFRFDRDRSIIKETEINVISQRYLVTAGIIYYFDSAAYKSTHFYAGLDVALGLSATTIDDATSTGNSYILPVAKVGFLNHVSVDYSLFIEAGFEAISQTEKFIDEESQKTNITNTKVTFGIKF
jgi:hypothetical protein